LSKDYIGLVEVVKMGCVWILYYIPYENFCPYVWP